MKFKTKEELDKESGETNIPDARCIAYREGLNDSFKSFGERIRFYKNYKIPSTGKGAFMSEYHDKMAKDKEHQKLRKKFMKYIDSCSFIIPDASTDELRNKLLDAISANTTHNNLPLSWNDWLFDYCFQDVIE